MSPLLGRILATSNAVGVCPAALTPANAEKESRPIETYTRTTDHLESLIVSIGAAFLCDTMLYAPPTAFVPHRHSGGRVLYLLTPN
jgi:hypothetical protein